MKTPLIFVLLFLAFQAFSQNNQFTFGLECSPNFTNVVRPYPYSIVFGETGFRPAINFGLKAGYVLTPRFTATGGLGYMTTREYEDFELSGDPNYDRIVSHRFHSYVFVPVGMKYYLGSFFISPEVAIGWNTSNTSKSTFYFTDGSSSAMNSEDPDNIYQVNAVTYPVFLTFGNEIKVKSCTIAIGMKSYYGLNPIGKLNQNNGHYYGFGVFGGVNF